MTETKETDLVVATQMNTLDVSSEPLGPTPLYSRTILPNNFVLSAKDLEELTELVIEANERAIIIEIQNINDERFSSAEEKEHHARDLMRVIHTYSSSNGNRFEGQGTPDTVNRLFPEDLKTYYASNSNYSKHIANVVPINTIELFLSFEKPSLKIDFQNMPSDPTENRSVIDINGKDEDWVISTTERVNQFFNSKKVIRPAIHGSGAYDYFIYFAFLPLVIFLFYQAEVKQSFEWLNKQSLFLNVVLGVYSILATLMVGQFLFKYVRWLLPPVEYYKKNRVGAYIHRAIGFTIFSAIAIGLTTDIISSIYNYFS